MEEGIVINEDSTAEELAPIAKAVNDLLVIPVTARSKNKKGVRAEKGEVIDFEYTGPILERVLKENRVIRTTPLTGRYARIPVVVTPIRRTCSIKGGIQKLKMAERAVCANLGNMHDFIFYFTT